jgi:hypothetical protein
MLIYIGIPAVVVLALGLVALLRCEPKHIPEVLRALFGRGG